MSDQGLGIRESLESWAASNDVGRDRLARLLAGADQQGASATTQARDERYIVPGLSSTAWPSIEQFDWVSRLNTAHDAIRRESSLNINLCGTFLKMRRDPKLDAKVRDVVGLYLAPPENAVVTCVDEKSQCQALERSQPILPMRPGIPERQTHDYARHGTTSLFAALNVATGQVTDACYPRHRHQEFLRFLLIETNNRNAHIPPSARLKTGHRFSRAVSLPP